MNTSAAFFGSFVDVTGVAVVICVIASGFVFCDPTRFKLEPFNPSLGSCSCEHGLVDRVDHFILTGTINYEGVAHPLESRMRLVLMGGGSYKDITSIGDIRVTVCAFTLQIPIDRCICVSDTGKAWAYVCNITAKLENSEKFFKMMWLPRKAMHVSDSLSLPIVFDICDRQGQGNPDDDTDPSHSGSAVEQRFDCEQCIKNGFCSMLCPNCAHGCCHRGRTCPYCKLGFKHPQNACALACEPYEYGLECLGMSPAEFMPGGPADCARGHGNSVSVDVHLLNLVTLLSVLPTAAVSVYGGTMC